MSQTGFMITRLVLTGPGLKDAELRFSVGLNVITGPSDTGKTFAFECIDFMLGASTLPKSIPEANGYDTLCLGIRDHQNDREFSLIRSLRGGPFRLVADDEQERVLGEKHKANEEDTVSQVLLSLAGLQNKWIRKNAKGETRSFSFRDVAHLSIISESEIIRKDSPLYSGQYTKKTEEESVYKTLLSGHDDSSIVQRSDRKETKHRVEAKEEVLTKLIDRVTSRIDETKTPADLISLRDQLHEIEDSLHLVTELLHETRESAVSLEEARRSSWTRLRQVESKLGVLTELQSRFSLLNEQYNSDILRLQALAESGRRLGEMNMDYCPVCGASSESQDRTHQECQTGPLVVAESCASEITRIQELVADLGVTRTDVERETGELKAEKTQVCDEFKEANSEIRGNLNPRLKEAIREMELWQGRREQIREAISLLEQRRELEELLDQLRIDPTDDADKPVFGELDPFHTESFAKKVEERLAAWKFPGLDRVTFDPKVWDILISGRSRSSHGKGVRAVTRAAFILSLLRYCLDNRLPHSGVVLIDSPLVVYRQPDTGEESFSDDVKAAFFRDLSQSFEDAQVIIVENETPPADVVSNSKTNIVPFTGTSQGRSGFIPRPDQSKTGASG